VLWWTSRVPGNVVKRRYIKWDICRVAEYVMKHPKGSLTLRIGIPMVRQTVPSV
jgi:hypothetical protein